MFTVTINEGPLTSDDNAVYFCDAEPKGLLIEFESPDGDMKFARFLAFTPSNGRDPGAPHRVPMERVVSVVG
jgi:hypothetical protein